MWTDETDIVFFKTFFQIDHSTRDLLVTRDVFHQDFLTTTDSLRSAKIIVFQTWPFPDYVNISNVNTNADIPSHLVNRLVCHFYF